MRLLSFTVSSGRIGAAGGQQQVAAERRPPRLTGLPIEEMIAGSSHVWAGEVFSSEVEGVEASCGARAEPGRWILRLTLQSGGGLRGGVARQYLLEQLGSSPGVRLLG